MLPPAPPVYLPHLTSQQMMLGGMQKQLDILRQKPWGVTQVYKFILMIVSPYRALDPCCQGPDAPQALFHLIPTADSQGGDCRFKDGETEAHTIAATRLKSPNKMVGRPAAFGPWSV